MIKSVSLLVRKEGLTHAQFMKHWVDVQSYILEERTRPDIPAMPGEVDGIAELWFDDRESMTRAMATPEAKALHADGALFIGRIKSFTVDEKVIIPKSDRS